jgi:hypothetical protein
MDNHQLHVCFIPAADERAQPLSIQMPSRGSDTVGISGHVDTGIGTALRAWLHARIGRKVRLKAGNVEVEAETLNDVGRILDQVRESLKESVGV